ncbi:MAG TPA: pyridoxal-phosphate dependent enzyme [Actinobacteria bacterium]|nr:threonine synthase [bacterium BMS3Bbin02]HDL42037.1 pyridoxal-phosphate dependent enzyme [Actinomycetota bacterium]
MHLQINPHIARLICSRTGEEVGNNDWSRPIGLSPAGFPVTIEYDLGAVASLSVATRTGLWTHRNLLPVWNVPDGYAADVGTTPTIRSAALSDRLGVDLWVKNENTNPSGSFKDRGLAVGVALGTALGAQGFFLPTQGNAGVAAALFSTRMGLLPCEVTMPEGYQGGFYHRAVEHYGGNVTFAGANIAAAGVAAREAMAGEVAAGRRVDLSTFFEPGRLEGKKTMGLEIITQFEDTLPDWIIYPTGGGTGLVGIWKAFTELRAIGTLRTDQKLPRMAAVQSEACAPVVEAFARGDETVSGVTSLGTIADGLDVPGAIMGHSILQVLRESGGTATAVSEDAIEGAFHDFARVGVPAGYETAATLAALETLLRSDTIEKGQRVLLLNTGGPSVALAKSMP